ncbi:hypothetical protein MTR67_038913 [Solanum verrucosum]|uniref:Uncharacterized protein n=1 Tax=Solanum verrucosum TaxID=315347 RepID=A0AAF0ZPX7_SOLVR|nr:hypothetical protein MTR67_038913 [Solanum verrucosum]
MNTQLITEEMESSKEVQKWTLARNKFMQQRSKCQWLKLGDYNTKFFHQMLKARRSNNRIFSVQNLAGKTQTNLEQIVEAFVKFHSELLGSAAIERDHVHSQVVNMGTMVNQEQRGLLEARVTDNEIKEALWAISGDKAPGPDCFESQFFKDSWEITKNDILEFIREFFMKGKMLKVWNRTVITLVPKIYHAEKWLGKRMRQLDYREIWRRLDRSTRGRGCRFSGVPDMEGT